MKDSGEAYDINQFTDLNLIWQKNPATFLLTFKSRQNLIISARVREEIPEMNTCYMRRNPLQLNKVEAYYPHVYASEYKKQEFFMQLDPVSRVTGIPGWYWILGINCSDTMGVGLVY